MLNTGGEVMPDFYKIDVITTGASQANGDKVFLGDLTGEGRADYMILGSSGKTMRLLTACKKRLWSPGGYQHLPLPKVQMVLR